MYESQILALVPPSGSKRECKWCVSTGMYKCSKNLTATSEFHALYQ